MAAPIPRDFEHLYQHTPAFANIGIQYPALAAQFGNGVNQNTRAPLAAASASTPILLALVSAQDPDHIVIVHFPTIYTPNFANPILNIDNEAFAIFGNTEAEVHPIHLPLDAFARTTVRTSTNPQGVRAALTAANPFHAIVAAGAPNSQDTQVRRVCLLPIDWADRATQSVAVTPAAFYDTFLAPLVGTPDVGNYVEIFNWWLAASTLVAGNGSGLLVASNNLPPAGYQAVRLMLQNRIKPFFDLMSPPDVDPLTNTAFTNTMGNLLTSFEASRTDATNRETARINRERAANAPSTVEDRWGAHARGILFNMCQVANEAGLPPLIIQLGRNNKNRKNDIAAIRAAIDQRADNNACLADDYTKPELTTHLVTLCRELRFVNLSEQLSDGLSPFPLVCVAEEAALAERNRVDSVLRLESTSTSLSFGDTEQMVKFHGKLPRDEIEASGISRPTASCWIYYSAQPILSLMLCVLLWYRSAHT